MPKEHPMDPYLRSLRATAARVSLEELASGIRVPSLIFVRFPAEMVLTGYLVAEGDNIRLETREGFPLALGGTGVAEDGTFDPYLVGITPAENSPHWSALALAVRHFDGYLRLVGIISKDFTAARAARAAYFAPVDQNVLTVVAKGGRQ